MGVHFPTCRACKHWTDDPKRPTNQKAIREPHPAVGLTAGIYALLLIAGEIEAMINVATGGERRTIEQIYAVYTDGYNTGFNRSSDVKVICASCPDMPRCVMARDAPVCDELNKKLGVQKR